MRFEATLSLVNRRAVQVALGADTQGHSKAGSCRGRSSLGRGSPEGEDGGWMSALRGGTAVLISPGGPGAASAGGECIRRRSDTGEGGEGIFLTTFFARQ